MALPHFHNILPVTKLVEPVYENLFEINFKIDLEKKYKKTLIEQFLSYKIEDDLLILEFNDNQHVDLQRVIDSMEKCTVVKIKQHDKTGKVFRKIKFKLTNNHFVFEYKQGYNLHDLCTMIFKLQIDDIFVK